MAPGDYNIQCTDGFGCLSDIYPTTTITSVTTPFTTSAFVTQPQCYNQQGYATFFASGGQLPFTLNACTISWRAICVNILTYRYHPLV